MSLTVVDSAGLGTAVNTTAQFTSPAVVVDDLFLMSVDTNPTVYVPPTPDGWTAGPVINVSASMRTWFFWKWAAGTEDGNAQGWVGATPWATSARKGLAWAAVNGVDKTTWDSMSDTDRFEVFSVLTSATTTNPTQAVSGVEFGTLSFWNERSSTPSTVSDLAAPADFTLTDDMTFVTGSGVCHGAVAWNLDPEAGSVGGGSWANLALGGTTAITVALPIIPLTPVDEPTLVQSDTEVVGAVTTIEATWPAPTTAGSTLVATLGISLVAGGTSVITPPSGWQLVGRVDNPLNCGVAIYKLENSGVRSGGEEFTVSAARDMDLTIDEWAPPSGSVLVVDTAGGGVTGTGTTAVSDDLDPAENVALRVVGVANRNTSTLSAPTNGFTERHEITSTNATVGNRVNLGVYDLVSTTSTALSCAVTVQTSRPWAALQVAFKLAGESVVNTRIWMRKSAGVLVPMRVFRKDGVSLTELFLRTAEIVPPVNALPMSGACVLSDNETNWQAFENQVGQIQVRRSYETNVPTSFAASKIAADISRNRVSVWSFKPSMTAWNNGSLDAAFNNFINGVPAGHDTTFLAWHEPEDQIAAGSFTLAQWKNCQNRLGQLVHATGRSELKTAICLRGPATFTTPSPYGVEGTTFWDPGFTANIDVIGFDPYMNVDNTGSSAYRQMSQKIGQAQSMAWAAEHGKPVAWTEYGCFDPDGPPSTRKAAWLDNAWEYAKANNLLYVCYFNINQAGASNGGNLIQPGSLPEARLRAHFAEANAANGYTG